MTLLALVGGFVIDTLTLRNIDGVFDNIVLITHLILSGAIIAVLFSRGGSLWTRIGNEHRARVLETILLFSFGALFSGFAIFYTRSSSFASSWPFILILFLIMIGTEFYKHFYKQTVFQITLYFVAVFSYLIILIPLLLNTMGSGVFLLSGAATIIFFALFALLLKSIHHEKFVTSWRKILASVGIFFVAFNIAYFANIIPPVPLSLRFTAVYHDVVKLYPGYEASFERAPWYNIIRKRSNVFHHTEGQPAWVFASVFAPTAFETDVVHRWEYFDEKELSWTYRGSVPLSIQGGSDKGWAGFSKRNNLEDGKWRVLVTTKRGQVIGSVYFTSVKTDTMPELVTERP